MFLLRLWFLVGLEGLLVVLAPTSGRIREEGLVAMHFKYNS